MKIVKILGYVILTLVVVVAIAVGLFAYTFDPNDYKAEIVKQVRQQTGRELTIEGDISLSFFPWLGFGLGKTGLSDDPAFSDAPFATVAAVEVRVRVEPLLRRRIEAGKIVVQGLALNLIRNQDGAGNWESLVASTDDGGGPSSEDAAPAGSEPGAGEEAPPIAGFAVGGLAVTDARVRFEDRQAGQILAIRDMNLETGEVDLAQPVDVNATLAFDIQQPPMSGTLELSSVAQLDLTEQLYRASDTRLKLAATGDGLPAGGLEAAMELAASVDMGKQLAKVEPLRVSLWNVGLEGSVEGRQIVDQPSFRGSLRVAEFSPKELIAALGEPVPETSDPSALSTAALEADFEATTDAARLSKLVVSLDQTRLDGSASVMNFAQPAIAFELAVDKIDLDRYLPPAGGEAAAEQEQAAGAPQADGALPLDALRALNLKGAARIGELKVNKLRATNAELTVNAAAGKLEVRPLKLDLYQGRAQGAAAMDVTRDTPRIRSQIAMTGVQAEPLLKDLTGAAQISGTGNVKADISASGASADAITRTLNGTTAMEFRDGAVNGINVARIIREAGARLKGQAIPQDNEPNQTDFTELSATATITDGLVENQDLLLKSPLIRVAGSGNASLPAETLDYRLNATVVGSLEGQGGRAADELKGVTVPVKIAGTFADPAIGPDMEALAKAGAKQLADKHKDKVTEKARERLQKQLGDEAGGQLGDQLGGALDRLLK